MNELLKRYPELEQVKTDIQKALDLIIGCYKSSGKLLLCGNGGSAADCEHIVGELMKGFLKKRSLSDETRLKMTENYPIENEILDKLQGGLPAVSLPSAMALNSAFCNDVEPDLIYAQQLISLGKRGDILIAISTSGNSENVVNAAKVAKSLGVNVISLTGIGGGKLKDISDVCICAPESETYKIQELHLPIYHYLCAKTEAYFFD